MPFKMEYIDGAGTVHPESFWTIRYFAMNLPNRDALLTYHGWHDAAAYAAGTPIIGDHIYNINAGPVFDSTIKVGASVRDSAYFLQLDGAALSLDGFFETAMTFAYIEPLSVPEIGSQGSDVLIVTWPSDLDTVASSLIAGVTIKVNGSPVVPTSASQETGNTQIYYVLPASVGPQDEVTWEYDGSGNLHFGDLIQPIAALSAVNTVGEYLRFNDPNNSIWIASR